MRQTLRLYLTLSPVKRTKYLKDQGVFAAMGENCSIMDRKVPLYANLIKLGDNVHIASKVDFIVHDIAHVMINKIGGEACPLKIKKEKGDSTKCSVDRNIGTSNIASIKAERSIFKKSLGGATAKEKIGCIEIGDNVFIGSNSTILGNVRIGSNVIVGACSLINKDVPDNCVVAGVPAKVIGSFDKFVHNRINENTYPDEFCVAGEAVDDKFAQWLWTEFYGTREKKWDK